MLQTKSSIPAGLSPLVYAYVVDCAPASPYAYSSSTHRFPDERTPIEATPLSATSAELGLGLGLGLRLDSLAHFSSHALPFYSPPSFHTLFLFPASLVCGGQTSPHNPRLFESHSTCPPLSSSPHAHSFVLGTAVIINNNSLSNPPSNKTQSTGSCAPARGRGPEPGCAWVHVRACAVCDDKPR